MHVPTMSFCLRTRDTSTYEIKAFGMPISLVITFFETMEEYALAFNATMTSISDFNVGLM